MTRISSIATYPVSVPRPEPVWTAHEELKAWSVILVEIKTDDGLIGYGEIHGAPIPRICDWVARFAEIVHGMDALAHEAVWARLFALTSPRAGVIEGKDGLPPPVPRSERTAVMAAIAGIDIALWDLKGKAAGLPVWRLLGGENRPLVTYATGGYYRPGMPNSAYAEEMARLHRAGLSRRQVEDRARRHRRRCRAGRRGARRDRRAAGADARHERALRSARLHRVCAPGRTAPHLLARRAAALVSAAGRFRAPRGGDADRLGAWRARTDPLYGARFHRAGRHPLRAVRRDARRRLYRGACASPRSPSSTASSSRRTARRKSTAISCWPCRAAPLGSSSHGGAETDPLAHGLFHDHPELRDGQVHFGDQPGFGLEPDWKFVERYRVQ